MRAFIAIELSDGIRESLARIQSHLKYPEFSSRDSADVKWVEKDNIHLTLKFLGEIAEEKCAKIKSILDEIGKLTKQFEISIKDIGAFPGIDFPRVIWVGLDKGAGESKELANRINEALCKLGFERESRPFAAHLTIGRVRSPKNKEALKEKIASYSLQPTVHSPQLISSVALFQSTLTPKGAVYTKLHETKLTG